MYSFEFAGYIGPKWAKTFYLQSSCIWNTYLLINKSQLNNDINNKEKFQKMRIPLFMLYSKFFCGYHTNPRLATLRDFAEVWIEFRSFLQFLFMREITKTGHLNCRVPLWKRKFKDFETGCSLFDNFFLHQKSNPTDSN